jgi:hypothetical protein
VPLARDLPKPGDTRSLPGSTGLRFLETGECPPVRHPSLWLFDYAIDSRPTIESRLTPSRHSPPYLWQAVPLAPATLSPDRPSQLDATKAAYVPVDETVSSFGLAIHPVHLA